MPPDVSVCCILDELATVVTADLTGCWGILLERPEWPPGVTESDSIAVERLIRVVSCDGHTEGLVVATGETTSLASELHDLVVVSVLLCSSGSVP